MRHSITNDRPFKLRAPRLWSIVFWLLAWQTLSFCIGQEILLVSPVTVVFRLLELFMEKSFWHSIFFSFVRIVTGFLLAMFAGILFAGLASRFEIIRELLSPAIFTMKATPVASFIILALIWIPSRNLSVFISFLMVMPILYTNVLKGIQNTDPKLLEMAQVFALSPIRRLRYIYVSQVLPYFSSACSVSLGLCWKSGIAAEVIGIPKGSIGENLYQAKIYLNTPDLFAWTLVIILISLLFERIFLFFIDTAVRQLERM